MAAPMVANAGAPSSWSTILSGFRRASSTAPFSWSYPLPGNAVLSAQLTKQAERYRSPTSRPRPVSSGSARCARTNPRFYLVTVDEAGGPLWAHVGRVGKRPTCAGCGAALGRGEALSAPVSAKRARVGCSSQYHRVR